LARNTLLFEWKEVRFERRREKKELDARGVGAPIRPVVISMHTAQETGLQVPSRVYLGKLFSGTWRQKGHIYVAKRPLEGGIKTMREKLKAAFG